MQTIDIEGGSGGNHTENKKEGFFRYFKIWNFLNLSGKEEEEIDGKGEEEKEEEEEEEMMRELFTFLKIMRIEARKKNSKLGVIVEKTMGNINDRMDRIYLKSVNELWSNKFAMIMNSTQARNKAIVAQETVTINFTNGQRVQTLPIKWGKIWPMGFEVIEFNEIDPTAYTSSTDEAFQIYMEEEYYAYPKYGCTKKEGAWDWCIDMLNLWDLEAFNQIYGPEKLPIFRCEAVGFYAAGLTKDFFKEAKVWEDEKTICVSRTAALEIALIASPTHFQSCGSFLRLPKVQWEDFCESIPEQLELKNPANISITMKNMIGEDVRDGTFTAKIKISYIIHE